jgi:hypothetical protein
MAKGPVRLAKLLLGDSLGRVGYWLRESREAEQVAHAPRIETNRSCPALTPMRREREAPGGCGDKTAKPSLATDVSQPRTEKTRIAPFSRPEL